MRTLALRATNPSSYEKILKLRNCATQGSYQEQFNKAGEIFCEQMKQMPHVDHSIATEIAKIEPVLRVRKKNAHQLLLLLNSLKLLLRGHMLPVTARKINDVREFFIKGGKIRKKSRISYDKEIRKKSN